MKSGGPLMADVYIGRAAKGLSGPFCDWLETGFFLWGELVPFIGDDGYLAPFLDESQTEFSVDEGKRVRRTGSPPRIFRSVAGGNLSRHASSKDFLKL